MDLSLFTDSPGRPWPRLFRHLHHRTLPVILRAQRATLLDARDDGLFAPGLAIVDAEEISLEMRSGPEG